MSPAEPTVEVEIGSILAVVARLRELRGSGLSGAELDRALLAVGDALVDLLPEDENPEALQ